MFVHSHIFIALFLKKNILILFTLQSPQMWFLIHSDMTNEKEDFHDKIMTAICNFHCGNKSFSTH